VGARRDARDPGRSNDLDQSNVRLLTQTHPRWVQVVQMFNHQTHHRGQAHAMLTAAGVDVGPTDVPVLPLLNQTPVSERTG